MHKALLAGQPTPWLTRLRTTPWRAGRRLLTALLAGGLAWAAQPVAAQVSQYTFGQSTTTYTPITGGTVAATATAGSNFSLDDANYTLAAGTLPFTFTFNGTGYTGLRINSNGYLTFGSTAASTAGYVPISASTGYAGAASAYGQDLVGDATAGSLGEIRYQTIGSAPNRSFVVQFTNFKRYVSAIQTADNLNFQIRLNETSNTVTFVYNVTATASTSSTQQVGLRGASNTVYVNRTTTTDWSASTPGSTNLASMTTTGTVKPASGLTYTFTPPACAGPTSLAAGSITTTSASISFTASASATSYNVTYTPQGGTATTVTPAPTASPVALTGLTPSTQYSVSITSNCGGGQTSTAATTTFTTLSPPPANDECTSATPITSIGVGTCGTAVAGTNVGATTSSTTGTPAPGCAGYAGGDVWYSLTVPANGIVQVSTDQGSGTSISDTGLALYSGSCGSLTLISCDDDSGPNAYSLIRATGLTPGSTIYARVWEYGNDATGSFTICAQTDAACAPPTTLAAGSITSTSASLSFTAGTGNTSYTVTYTPQGGTATTVMPAPTASPVTVTGLTPSTQYTVTVTGNCAGGQTSTAATTTFTTLGTPPANDECASATPITNIGVGTCGTAVAGTNVNATASAGVPAPGCASYAGGDVWFSLVVPANGIVQVSTDQGSGTSISDTGLALYSGSCGSLTLISCDDDSGPNAYSLIRATGLTPGSTIYARVWEYGNDATGSFTICAQTDAACAPPTALSAGSVTSTSASLSFTAGTGNTSYTVTYTPQGGSATTVTPAPTASPVALTGLTPSTQYTVTVTGNCAGGQTSTAATTTFTTLGTPPANDECTSATPITSIGVGTCGTAVAGTNAGATTSSTTGTPAPGCAGYAGGDVWYSLTVPANGIVQVSTDQGSGTSISDTGLALYSGSCGNLTLISCDDDSGPNAYSLIRATGLTPGSTIYARVWEYGNDATGSFTICAQTDAACAPPTALAAGSITSTSASISFTPGTGNTSYVVRYTMQGDTTSTRILPNPTASPVSLTGLTPSTTYTVRIIGNCAGSQTSPTATTTFTTLALPPANDECASATPITSIGVGSCGTVFTGTNAGATASAGVPAPGCANYAGGDVWYSLTVPANGIVQVSTDQGSGTSISDTGLALYSGSCGSLSLISCDDDSGPNAYSLIRATGLTPGSTIYARVWEYGNDATGSFTICAQTDAPSLTISTPQNVQGTYTNVTITSGGAARLTGPLTVTGTLTVQDGGILATNCQPITGSGSFVLLAGGHLRICDAAGISTTGATGAIQLTGTRTFSNDAIYAYNGTTSGQATGSGLPSRARALLVRNSNGLALSSPLQLGQGILLNGGDLTTSGNALTLLSNASGTALVVNRNGVINGNVTVQRYIDPSLNSGPGYRHYSAPVSNTTVADLATAAFAPVVNPAYNTSATPNLVTPFPTVFGYDESRVLTSPATTYGPFDKGWVSPSATNDALTPGRGYTVNIAASQTVDFVGTPGNGPVVRALSRNGGANGGLHLVGNPYPAPIDWSQLTVPAGLDNAMYVYQSTSQYGGSYRSYVNGFGSPRIASGQGFFVRVSPGASSAVLTMTNALRDTSFVTAPSFNRGVETRPAVQLTLTRPGAPMADEATVYFEAGATAGVDTRYDALKLQHNSGGVPSVYALTAGAELSINGLPALTARTVVPLGIDVPQAGSYTFEAAQVLNLTTASVYLHDVQTGQYLDLHQQPRYSFTAAAAGAQNARFELVFEPQRPTATASGLTAASVALFPNPAHSSFALLVPAVPGATQVQATLLNSLGQEVRRQAKALPASGTRLDVDVTGLATGVYTVRLQAGNAQVTKRVVVE